MDEFNCKLSQDSQDKNIFKVAKYIALISTKLTRKQFLRWSGFGFMTALATGNASAVVPEGSTLLGTPKNPARAPEVKVNQIKDITLRFAGTGISQINKIRDKAQEDLGFRIELRALSTEENNYLAITQPTQFDIYDGEYFSLPLVVPAGNLQPFNVTRITDFNKIIPIFTKGELYAGAKVNISQGNAPFKVMFLERQDSTEFAREPTNWATLIPFQYNADSLGYRPDLVDSRISSWGDLLSQDLQGKTSIVDIPVLGIMDAAMAAEALGLMSFRDKGDMTREEIDRLISILSEYKNSGQFYGFWQTFDESVQQMYRGEVILQSILQPAVILLRRNGIPCLQASLQEGYRGWGGGIGLSANLSGIALDAAYEYVNWMLDGWVGAYLSRQGYYCAVPENARRFMSQAEWEFWYEGKPATEDIFDPFGRKLASANSVRDGGSFNDRMGNVALWSSIMQEQVYLVQRWNELVAS